MDDHFYRAFLEGDHGAFGETLKPFSLWHSFLLQAIESPFVTGEAVEVHDLAIACQIFKTSYPNEPDLRFSFRRWWRIWRLKRNLNKLKAETENIGKYIKANSSFPRFWQNVNKSKKEGLTAPDSLAVVVSLLGFGWNEIDAWNLSVGRGRWYEAAMMERQSSEVRFFYDSDVEGIESTTANMTEEEILEQAKKDLGDEGGQAWWDKRQEKLKQC